MICRFSRKQLHHGFAPINIISALSNDDKKMKKPLEKIRLKIAEYSKSGLSWIVCIVGHILIFNNPDYL